MHLANSCFQIASQIKVQNKEYLREMPLAEEWET